MSFILFIKLRTYYIIIFLALLFTRKTTTQKKRLFIYCVRCVGLLFDGEKKNRKRLANGKNDADIKGCDVTNRMKCHTLIFILKWK